MEKKGLIEKMESTELDNAFDVEIAGEFSFELLERRDNAAMSEIAIGDICTSTSTSCDCSSSSSSCC